MMSRGIPMRAGSGRVLLRSAYTTWVEGMVMASHVGLPGPRSPSQRTRTASTVDGDDVVAVEGATCDCEGEFGFADCG